MKVCPHCGTTLRKMITNHPFIDHDLVEGYECPECKYDSVYDSEEPKEEPEEEE